MTLSVVKDKNIPRKTDIFRRSFRNNFLIDFHKHLHRVRKGL
ncbi:MAG: hypothetical protein ACI81G_000794 [Gammaproteobacteria bacterium]